jgi:uncharacterized protein (TIGR00251 family)
MSDPEPLELVEVPGGTRVRLRVKAGARRSAILGPHGGALKVAVAAAPERGKANRAVLDLLGGALALSPSSIRILSGETSPDKAVLIPLPPGEIALRLKPRG